MGPPILEGANIIMVIISNSISHLIERNQARQWLIAMNQMNIEAYHPNSNESTFSPEIP